jgi:hypothetical protein
VQHPVGAIVKVEQQHGGIASLRWTLDAASHTREREREREAPDTLTQRGERIAGIHGISIDAIELYKRNMIDELAVRLVHGELPVGS